MMGMLGCAILIPGPPGLLGVFQVGIYAGMMMYFPTTVLLGPGAAYVSLLYLIQIGWTLLAGAGALYVDPNAIRILAASNPSAADEGAESDEPAPRISQHTVTSEPTS